MLQISGLPNINLSKEILNIFKNKLLMDTAAAASNEEFLFQPPEN